jgi:iron complex transport system substrate-binding protein
MWRTLIVALALTFTLPAAGAARDITDMAGHTVTIADRISRVYAASPPATYLLYAIDPSLVVALNFPLRAEERRWLRLEFTGLPVAGGLLGQGRNVNMETLLMLKPDVVLFWAWKETAINEQVTEPLKRVGIPAVALDLDRLDGYPAAITFLGDLLDRKERARALATYAQETLRSVTAAISGIPEQERLSVYYAEGTDGLATERETSVHAELIGLAGGKNVHRGQALDHMGMEKVSLEQVLVYDPEVIVVQERAFYDAVMKDARWSGIRAVRTKRVYLVPRLPFNWFDRPPSVMRILGLKWLANALYPERYRLDLASETKAFYRLFLGVELTDKDVQEVIRQ